MNVTLTDEQQEIRSVARQFLDGVTSSEGLRAPEVRRVGFDELVWRQIAELGWPGMCLSEDLGGLDFGQVERCLLMEEMGRVLLPSPFLSSAVLAADALMLAGSGDVPAELLTRLALGEIRAALVAGGDLHAGEDLAGRVSAGCDAAEQWCLSGNGGLALDGASAEVLLIAAAPGGERVGLFVVDIDAPGLSRVPAALIDQTRQFAEVRLDQVPARRVDGDGDTESALRTAVLRGTVALAAEMVGGAQRCLEMCVQYAKDRRQFGVPIGSFQVIKHRCAILAVDIDAAREAVMLAAEVLTDGDPVDAEIVTCAAKAAAGDTFQTAVRDTVQIHGGIGYTDEHDAHLYFNRAQTSGLTLGSSAQHRHRIAELLDV
jgi:alkylation response protein AidB-like acyl-CoA dehydrogenase